MEATSAKKGESLNDKPNVNIRDDILMEVQEAYDINEPEIVSLKSKKSSILNLSEVEEQLLN